ncbi:MAG: ATP-binding protein [Actinomycetota bacterium]|nr:ATP-binding protein [Actinomycetota bacterium]
MTDRLGNYFVRFMRLRSVRWRTTIAAVLVVSIALFVAGLFLVKNVIDVFNQGALNLARAEISTASVLLKGREIVNPLPAPRGDLGVQVVDAQGKVVASTANFAGLTPIVPITNSTSQVTMLSTSNLSVLRGRFKGDFNGVLVGERLPISADGLQVVHIDDITGKLPTGDPSETRIDASPPTNNNQGSIASQPTVFVLVWASLSSREQSTHTISTSLLILFPLLIIFVGLLSYLLTGAALRPVRKIRSEVDDISGSNLHRRVFEPSTDDEIEALAHTMNQMLDRIESSTERQRQFVSDASHELRTPIATIRAELEIALIHPEATEIPIALNAALEEADRMARIVSDLLTLAKMDEGALKPKFETVDLDELILGEVRRLRLHKNVEVLTNIAAARISADGDQILRVIRNLLENAARHCASSVSIAMRRVLVESVDFIEVSICDDGPGIPIEIRKKVFERFHRAEQDRARLTGGSGLGLSIVAGLVEAHHGTIEVSDEVGELLGAHFILRLPLDVAYDDVDEEDIQQNITYAD